MVAVDLGSAAGREETRQERLAVADREAQVGQAALVAAARGVANDYRQNVDAEVIVIRPPHAAAEQEATIAAAQVEHQRRPPAKERLDVEAALGGQLFQRRLRPQGRIQDLAGDGNAELALDRAALLLRFHATSANAGNSGLAPCFIV